MVPEGDLPRSYLTENASKTLEKQTFLANPATQQIRMGAGAPLRCLMDAPATHWRGSTSGKVPQNRSKNVGKTNTFGDPRFATNEGSLDVFQITAVFPGTSITP